MVLRLVNRATRRTAIAVSAILAAAFFIAVAPSAHATGLTYDATGSAKAAGTSSLSWSQAISGTSTALLVGVGVGTTGSDASCSVSVTWNGTGATSLGKVHANNSTHGFEQVFGLTGAATGTHTVAVTVTGCPPSELTGGSESFSGAAQAGTFGTAKTAFGSGTRPAITTTGSTSGNIIAGFAAAGSGITSATSPSTSRYIQNQDINTGAGNSAGATSPATGSNVTMAWTSITDWWGVVAIQVTAAGGQLAPAVVTQAATGITSTAATLNGTVNPEGASTTYHFEYGTTIAYGTSIPVPDGSAGSGATAVAESANVTGLAANTLYHYRLDATNSGGTTSGSDQSLTTTSASCSPGTPITISTGGTYSGCYTSTSTTTPAVTISTSSAVTLSHATIISAGNGVVGGASPRPNLTITDSTFSATSPGGTAVHQMCVYADAPSALDIEHNQFTGCQGILVNGESMTTSPFTVSYNNYTDIGKYNQSDWNAGAVHTQNLTAPGGTVDWNRITSHYTTSVSEDVFGMVSTNGSSASPIDISHNLVNGDYPYTGAGSSFSGVAFDLADVSGSYMNANNDTAVNYAGSGFAADTGTHITFSNDTAVSDGLADNGSRVNATFGDGFSTWNNPGYPPSGPVLWVANSSSGHLRWNGSAFERADYYLPVCDPSTACTGDTSLGTVNGAAETSAVNAYESSVTNAGVTIGPRP